MRSRLFVFLVIRMNIEKHLLDSAKMAVRAEIEKAVDKVKLGMIPRKPRTELGKWFRRRYYIEAARGRKCREWKQKKGGEQWGRGRQRKRRNKPIPFNTENKSNRR